jgi:hypothetical protein
MVVYASLSLRAEAVLPPNPCTQSWRTSTRRTPGSLARLADGAYGPASVDLAPSA